MQNPLIFKITRVRSSLNLSMALLGLFMLSSAAHAAITVTERPRNLNVTGYLGYTPLKPGQMEGSAAITESELIETYDRCLIRPTGSYQPALSQFLTGLYGEPVTLELQGQKRVAGRYPYQSWGVSYECEVSETAPGQRLIAKCTALLDAYTYASVKLMARGEVPSTTLIARLPDYARQAEIVYSEAPKKDGWGRSLPVQSWFANIRFPAEDRVGNQGMVYNWERRETMTSEYGFNRLDKTELQFPYAWTEQCLRYEFYEAQKAAR